MKYEHDFLISYAHIDDQSLVDGEKGWVSTLHRLLEIRVGQLRGQVPKIWRDPKLQGNDYFADTILDRLPKVAALVSVLSPRYVLSEWCNRELKEFWRAAEQTGGVRVADKARIFKVVKTPVEHDRLPREVQPMIGYEFFTYDPESGRPRELESLSGTANRAFLTKLDDLAYDIAQLLELLEKNGGGAPAAPRKGTVFLAETTLELRDEREAIKRDLIRNGFEVLPDRPLPHTEADLEEVCNELLSRCTLSIHLVGKNYGIVPEGAVQSVPERQQTLAAARGAASGLSSIIWISPGIEVEDERQRIFIRHLQTDPAIHDMAELLEVPLEDVKTLIYRKLTAPVPQVKVADAVAMDLKRVYLLCDQQDGDSPALLADYLFGQGYEVILPIFDQDEAQTRIEHEESLRFADAVLVYYGAGSDLWLRRKLRDMQKSAGLGREKPWLVRAIYVGPPHTDQKQRFRTLEMSIFHEPPGGFDPNVLAPFVQALRDDARGAS